MSGTDNLLLAFLIIELHNRDYSLEEIIAETGASISFIEDVLTAHSLAIRSLHGEW